ncbi:transposase family protein [Phytohabitans flavus]|uniref:transposase family protein n=1 Tax=Phytohabitans flavus TaxID=1076124 RepID=UPI0036452BF6
MDRRAPAGPGRSGLRGRGRHHHRGVQEAQGRATHRHAQQTYDKVHNGIRAIGERGNSLLKTTFKALRNVSLCPRRIGDIVAAALVLLHIEHGRTT